MRKILKELSILFLLFIISCGISKESDEDNSSERQRSSLNESARRFYFIGEVDASLLSIINQDTTILDFSNRDSLINRIIYPQIAIYAGIKGNVVVKLNFDLYRKIQDAKIVQSLGGGTDEAVIKALNNFEFKFSDNINLDNLNYFLVVSFILKIDTRWHN